MNTAKTTFQAELLQLMGRHRFTGLPTRVTIRIRTAAAAGDQETLNEWLPHAVAKMIQPRNQR